MIDLFVEETRRGQGIGTKMLGMMEECFKEEGCDSESSCRAVCGQEANQEKCSRFAQETGLGGGVRRVGPGGCNSEASCRAFCESNPEECRKFGGPPEGAGGGRRGPGVVIARNHVGGIVRRIRVSAVVDKALVGKNQEAENTQVVVERKFAGHQPPQVY